MYWHLLGQKNKDDSFEYSDDGRSDVHVISDNHGSNTSNSDLFFNSPLDGISFSINNAHSHTFFVDSFFDLGEGSSNFSLSTVKKVSVGEGEGFIKVRIP